MIETVGEDIFDQMNHADAVCIPTNCTVDEDGLNPMGALAGQFARRWIELSGIYGYLLRFIPNVPIILGYVKKERDVVLSKRKFVSALDTQKCCRIIPGMYCSIVAVPTMNTISEPADLNLVVRSAKLLVEIADLNFWEDVYVPSLGTGIGGLPVYDVHSKLADIFDNRFTVMIKEGV